MGNFLHHGGREDPGLPVQDRFARYGVSGPLGQERMSQAQRAFAFLYCGVDGDPSWFSPEPPPQVQAAFEDVFRPEDRMDPDGVPHLKLALHPIINRWCLYERDKRFGHQVYAVVSIFSEECPDDQYVASDFRNDEALQHLYGTVGEYRLPNRRDFEIIQSTNAHTQTLDERERAYAMGPDEEERDAARRMEDFEHDLASYYGLMSMRARDDDTWKYQVSWNEKDESWTHRKWVEVDRGGYKVRYRIRPEDRDEFEEIRKRGPLPTETFDDFIARVKTPPEPEAKEETRELETVPVKVPVARS